MDQMLNPMATTVEPHARESAGRSGAASRLAGILRNHRAFVRRYPVRNRNQRSPCMSGKALMGIAGSIVRSTIAGSRYSKVYEAH
jgi:hypothetical protein